VLALAASCHSSGGARTDGAWHGPIDIHGAMREVMMEGKTQGRVALDTLQGDPALVAIGALAGLEGELVALDGIVWTTRAKPLGVLETHAGATHGEQATMLASARVESWIRVPIPGGLAWQGLDEFVEQAAREHGLERTPTFPFVIEGGLFEVRAHVLNGRCPMGGPGPAESEPVRRFLPEVHARLVGFYTTLPPGTLTHHGQRTHLHLLVKEGEPIAAHVDDLRVAPGAVLKLPRGR
jgi:hypothetical protein